MHARPRSRAALVTVVLALLFLSTCSEMQVPVSLTFAADGISRIENVTDRIGGIHCCKKNGRINN